MHVVKSSHFVGMWLIVFLINSNLCEAGLLNNLNLGLTIPAMEVSVPAPSLPNVKVKTVIKKPPKQSLKSLLPRFSYNIPTFGEDSYDNHSPYMAFSASNRNPTILESTPLHDYHYQNSLRPTAQSSQPTQTHTQAYSPETQVQFNQPSKERQHPHQQNTVQLGQYARLQSPYTTLDEFQQRFGYGMGEKNFNAYASTSTGPIGGRKPYRFV